MQTLICLTWYYRKIRTIENSIEFLNIYFYRIKVKEKVKWNANIFSYKNKMHNDEVFANFKYSIKFVHYFQFQMTIKIQLVY